MFHIGSKQFDRLDQSAAAGFVDRLVAQVTACFPDHAAALGPQGTREAVSTAIEGARNWGLEMESDVVLYTCLSFAFGMGFDEDPAIPWARATLRSKILGSPSDRIARTYDLAIASITGSGNPWVPPPRSAASMPARS